MHVQLMRYAIVGFAANMLLYLGYLLTTGFGVEHKTAMTLIYVVGVLLTFLFNRLWTFEHHGNVSSALLRYAAVYGLGYLFNLCFLYLFVDELGFPHQAVQGILILVIAALLFLLQKFWVFRASQQKIPEFHV